MSYRKHCTTRHTIHRYENNKWFVCLVTKHHLPTHFRVYNMTTKVNVFSISRWKWLR